MESEQRLIWCFICSFFLVIASVIGITLLAEAMGPRAPRYSVAIDSFSGLPAATLVLNPEFNMTLRVASTSLRRSACVEPGTYVEVSYRCVPLAASATITERFYAGPRKTREEPIIAGAVAVHLPGHLMDGLVTDVRSGMEVFDVTLRRSGYGGDDYEDVRLASCGGRRVGNVVDDLQNTCDAWHSCPSPSQAKTINEQRH